MARAKARAVPLPAIPDAAAQIAGFVFALMLVDPDLQVVEANHAAEELLGKSAKRLIGRLLTEVVGLSGSGVPERLAQDSAQLVARGIPVGIGGQTRQVNLTISPLAGHPGWRVVTLSDAGRDDMANRDDGNASLQAPAILAHEIKNPLAAIRGAGQLIARKLDRSDRQLTDMIAREVDRIAGLIDRMQALGSRRTGPLEKVNLHRAIRSAMATVRAAGAGRAELVEEFDPSLPDVAAHREALEQVMINLLSNAVEAAEEVAAPRIVVRTRFVSGLAANVFRYGRSVRLPIEITVSDNGPGLDPALGEHIFDPFVTTKKNGQGLGLALVKKLVGDMGGRISHRRDEANGETLFHLHLARSEGQMP